MGDRSGSLSRVRMSEHKVRRKDLCGSVRAVYVLEKLPDVSGPGLVEVGCYIDDLSISVSIDDLGDRSDSKDLAGLWGGRRACKTYHLVCHGNSMHTPT